MSVGNRLKFTNASIANQHEPGRTSQVLDKWIGDDGSTIFQISSDGVVSGAGSFTGSVVAGLSTTASVVVPVSSAEIQTLNSVGKELVAAPGAGSVLEFLSAVVIYDFAGEAYDLGGTLNVLNGSTVVSNVISTANSLAATADKVAFCVALDTANGILLTDNGALTLKCNTADFGDGATDIAAGVLRVIVNYRVHTTGL